MTILTGALPFLPGINVQREGKARNTSAKLTRPGAAAASEDPPCPLEGWLLEHLLGPQSEEASGSDCKEGPVCLYQVGSISLSYVIGLLRKSHLCRVTASIRQSWAVGLSWAACPCGAGDLPQAFQVTAVLAGNAGWLGPLGAKGAVYSYPG
jgi:hypothetical protein